MKRMNRKRILKLLIIVCLFLCGCTNRRDTTKTNRYDLDVSKQIQALKKSNRNLYVWSVYWDCTSDVRTIQRNRKKIDGIGVFSAYYPDGKTLSLPEKSNDLIQHLASIEDEPAIPRYLCVVNDTDSENKSVDLLKEIMKESEKNAQSIVDMAIQNQCMGIEIDFENIRNDINLWNQFINFEKDLMDLCSKNHLALRIVLESSTPVDQIDLPSGPEYVVMCYNLYGNGTKPGPKADMDFLKDMVAKFESLDHVSYALANGGYDFEGSKKAEAVTSSQIQTLILEKKAKPKRDPSSQALYFTYGSHTVWFADEKTLTFWAKILDTAAGRTVDISLWRLFRNE
ncbi:hypothetical protein [Absicoccus porci]|jgi:spore germination protein|uniref:hypothetical protein n=1 Tax=Absicoccus porci TaxID=2486576 RepID=UPI003D90215D